MKNRISTIKESKKQIRPMRLICLLLSIVLLAGLPLQSFADQGTVTMGKGYEWTRIRSQEDLKAWEDGLALKGDSSYTNDSDWVRALFVYNGRYYIDGYRVNSSGGYYLPRVDSNEAFQGAVIPVTYGIDLTKDTFKTRTGLNAPFIKYRGWDGDNDCYKFAVRMAKNDELSKTLWLENLSWYGVAWHAAAYSEYRFCDYDNISAYKAKCACSADTMTDVSLQFKTSGSFKDYVHPFYNIKGVSDRCWNHDGGITIYSDKDEDDDESCFMLYLGYPCDSPVETLSSALEVGETVVWNGKVVGRDTVVTVKEGSTLVIDGKCYNNGKILIDGGTVIVKGVLDMDIIDNETGTHAFPPGSIELKNGGLLYVEYSGCLLQRYKTSGVDVSGASSVIVHGSAVISGHLNVSDYSRFESDFGSFVGICVSPSVTLEQTNYSPMLLKEYENNYASALFGSQSGDGLMVKNNSAVYLNGGCLLESSIASGQTKNSADTSSCIVGRQSRNINATLSSMLVKW